MPPATQVLSHGITLAQWPTHKDLQQLRTYAAEWVKAKQGHKGEIRELLQKGYDALPACVISGGSQGLATIHVGQG
jgi:hypothetical protein